MGEGESEESEREAVGSDRGFAVKREKGEMMTTYHYSRDLRKNGIS